MFRRIQKLVAILVLLMLQELSYSFSRKTTIKAGEDVNKARELREPVDSKLLEKLKKETGREK